MATKESRRDSVHSGYVRFGPELRCTQPVSRFVKIDIYGSGRCVVFDLRLVRLLVCPIISVGGNGDCPVCRRMPVHRGYVERRRVEMYSYELPVRETLN